MTAWIVELEPGVWLAPWNSDPGRTLERDSARRFKSRMAAEQAIADARLYRAFPDAQIVGVDSLRTV